VIAKKLGDNCIVFENFTASIVDLMVTNIRIASKLNLRMNAILLEYHNKTAFNTINPTITNHIFFKISKSKIIAHCTLLVLYDNITKVVSSNLVHGKVYSIQHYVIKFVSDLQQVCGFFRVLRFPPPIKLTAMI